MAQEVSVTGVSVLDRYNRAAAELATTVDVLDRIRTDPSTAASRSENADTIRARMFEESLANFRAAREALRAEEVAA